MIDVLFAAVLFTGGIIFTIHFPWLIVFVLLIAIIAWIAASGRRLIAVSGARLWLMISDRQTWCDPLAWSVVAMLLMILTSTWWGPVVFPP